MSHDPRRLAAMTTTVSARSRRHRRPPSLARLRTEHPPRPLPRALLAPEVVQPLHGRPHWHSSAAHHRATVTSSRLDDPLCTGSPARSPSPIRNVGRAPTVFQLVYKRLDASGHSRNELPHLALIHRFPDVSASAHATVLSALKRPRRRSRWLRLALSETERRGHAERALFVSAYGNGPRHHACGRRPRCRCPTAVTHLLGDSFSPSARRPISNALPLVHRSLPWTTTATNPSNPPQ